MVERRGSLAVCCLRFHPFQMNSIQMANHTSYQLQLTWVVYTEEHREHSCVLCAMWFSLTPL